MKVELASYQLPKLPEPGQAIYCVVHTPILGDRIRFDVFVDNQENACEMG
jgi:hypothetical protein